MGRFARSWSLMKSSWAVLAKDRQLVVLPAISGALLLVVAGSFVLATGVWREDADRLAPGNLVAYFAFYVVTYTIGFFFQAALVAGALQRLEGRDPTLSSALGAARARFGAILLWGVIAGTVGMLLRAVQERSELVGKIVAALVGVAWSLATFFMVPVIVMEHQPVGDSFRRSWALFKKTWGETVIGNGGLGLVGFLAVLGVVLLAAPLAAAGLWIMAIAVFALGIIAVSVVMSALSGIYLASLYRFATTGEVAAGFDRDALAGAYRPK